MEIEGLKEVVDKLIGPIYPVGSASGDLTKKLNARKQMELIDYLVKQLEEVGSIVEYGQESLVQSKTEAQEYLLSLSGELIEWARGDK